MHLLLVWQVINAKGLKRAFSSQRLVAIEISILKGRLCLFYQTVCMLTALRYDSYMLQMYYAPISEDVKWHLPQPLQPNWLFNLDIIVPHECSFLYVMV